MKRRRIKEEKSVDNLFAADTNPRRFFKLILSPTSQSIYLRIPDKFCKAYDDDFCTNTIAILTVPTGEAWEVTTVKQDDKLWFHKGWRKFVDSYSINYGYFLMFTYEGNMRFNVNVFDLTTCEISYGKDDLRFGNGDGDDDDTDFECLGSPPLSSPDEIADAQVVELDGDGDGDRGGDGDDGDEEEVKSQDERGDHSNDSPVDRQGDRFKSLAARLYQNKELLRAVIAAGIPMPGNPFFLSVLKPYNLLKSYHVNIPKDFAKEIIRSKVEGANKSVTFEASDGKQWEITCRISGSKGMFSRGWITFARHYQFEVGDVCVYEIIPSDQNVIKVQVVKNSLIKAAGFNF